MRPTHDCRGAGLGAFRPDVDCRICWLAKNTTEYAAAWGEPTPDKPIALPHQRKALCVHIGRRLEFNNLFSCQCLHDCDLGLPAVPGTYCKTCPSYEVDE